jgi:DNA polymerase III delta prime subunit
MIRKKLHKHQEGPIIIDLTGPDGNAFALLAHAKKFSQDLDKPYEELLKQMQSGDYENLIKVFDEAFGDFVILER